MLFVSTIAYSECYRVQLLYVVNNVSGLALTRGRADYFWHKFIDKQPEMRLRCDVGKAKTFSSYNRKYWPTTVGLTFEFDLRGVDMHQHTI